MIEQLLPLIAGIVKGIVSVLESNDVPKPIVDALSVLEVALDSSDDLIEDLEKLREEVAKMAAEGKNPSIERLDQLQTAVDNTMIRFRAAQARALELPGDDE